jgi:polyisoprenoid-binding protein YceI
MKENRTLIGGLVIAAIGVIVIGVIWYFVLRTPEEASEPIEAIPLELPTETATAVPEPTDEPTEIPPTQTIAPEATTEATATTELPTATPEPTADPGVLLVYEISQDESEVRFLIDEELRGSPNLVVGVTNQVAGQIAANLQELSTTQVGVIQVNARTFLTDNDFRNNAIRNRILNTDQYEFVTFTPTAVNGLPDSTTIGEELTFEIVGDLTVRDVTQPVTFVVTATAVSETRLEASATAEILRADYNLTIPQVPGVANVAENIILEFDLVANAVQ